MNTIGIGLLSVALLVSTLVNNHQDKVIDELQAKQHQYEESCPLISQSSALKQSQIEILEQQLNELKGE